MGTPVTVDIEDLPEPARVALTHAIEQRQYAMSQPAGSWHALLFFGGIAALVYALYAGYGSISEPTQSVEYIALYALGFGGIAFGAVMHLKRRALRKVLGFAPGVYVLGSRFLDARDRKLKTYALLDSKPHITDHYQNGVYQRTTIAWHGTTFTYRNQGAASSALGRIDDTLGQLSQAAQQNDIAALLMLDPVTVGTAIIADQPKQRRDPGKTWLAPVIALASVAALSPGAWFLRNHLSLEAAFDNIYSPYDVDTWVAHGGDPDRGHQKKMELEMTQVLRWDSERADKLREVLEKYPDAPANLKDPVIAALKARYVKARKEALALSSAEQVTWFVNQVYDRLEKGGAVAAMQIKVARTDNSALEKLDEFIASRPSLAADIVPVAKYFGTADDEVRTSRLKSAIELGLAQFFPSDVMKFDATAKDTPEIEIFYVIRPKIRPDGTPSLYTEMDRTGRPIPGAKSYPGIQFELGATLKVPGGPEPQAVTFNATPAPTISVRDNADHSAIYFAMAESAFGDLQGKLVAALGGKSEPPPEPSPLDEPY